MSAQKNGGAILDKTKSYRPTDKEPFMNERQREYFRQKLLAWKEEILKEARETLAHLQAENENHPDLADRASSETDQDTVDLDERMDDLLRFHDIRQRAIRRLLLGLAANGDGAKPPLHPRRQHPRCAL